MMMLAIQFVGRPIPMLLVTASPRFPRARCACGNYTLNAYVTPVEGKTDRRDNDVTCSISVSIPGDIDGNFRVNLADLVGLAQAYGSRSGDSNWNANADIDGNNAVGLSDLVMLAQHYGQHLPLIN